jgi:hypothetical protein
VRAFATAAAEKFLVEAPGCVFPVSYEDTASGVFATAIAALLLGRAVAGRDRKT